MATSNTFTPDSTFDILTIVEDAYERVGREVRGGYELRSARRSLDLLLKEWTNRGVNLWTIAQKTQAISAGDTSFTASSDVIDVLEMNWREGTGSDQIDRVMTRISVAEWSHIANKNLTADPTEYWVNRVNPPVVNFWPKANEAGTIVYYVMRHMEDAGAYTNNPDVPPRFLPALHAGLAYYLGMKETSSGQLSLNHVTFLKEEYDRQYELAAGEDREKTPLRLVPRLR